MNTVIRPLLFVSYNQKDSKFAHQLKTSLEAAEVDLYVWLWEDEVLIGDSSTDRTKDAMRRATHVLVVLSQDSLAAQGVAQEIGAATFS